MFQKPKDHHGQNTVGDRGKQTKLPGREPGSDCKEQCKPRTKYEIYSDVMGSHWGVLIRGVP